VKKAIKPYQLLATLYEAGGWADFSLKYLQLIDILSKKYNIMSKLIIDVACGTGKLAAELYKRNYRVIGVDISPEMIEVARRKNPNIQFYVADIKFMKLGVEADLVTCAFDSMNYLLDDLQLSEVCQNIYRHLKHEGYFLFDFNTPAHYEKKSPFTIDQDIEGKKFKHTGEYNKERRIAKITFDFGNGEIEEHIQRAYTTEDVASCLSTSGFKVLEVFQDFESTPPNETSERVFYFAQKIEHGK
jgi:SAM-dependent methyltransferase